MRDVDERVKWFLDNRPEAAGRCAEHVMHALDVPKQGLPDATAVGRRVIVEGHMQRGAVPKGAIRYWDGGGQGHGHVALEYDDNAHVASTDVAGPRTVGVRPFFWFQQNWGNLRYLGWSWWWGSINTEEKQVAPKPYIVVKVETDQKITLNKWIKADLGQTDQIMPPVGANDWDFYANFDRTTLVGAGPNDLRYILGRWARHDAGSPDSGDNGMDETGADTKTVPFDLPKRLLRYTWTHGFKGEAGVPVSFWLYVGSMKEGSIVSKMRIFKVDDES
jgi:hypothetical protein